LNRFKIGIISCLGLCIVMSTNGYSQSWVQDTLQVEIDSTITTTMPNAKLETVVDSRDEHPRVIRRYEKNEIWFDTDRFAH